MKKMVLGSHGILFSLVFFGMLNFAHAQTKKTYIEPRFFYKEVVTNGEFDTPQAALHSLQNWYDNNHSPHYKWIFSNLQPEPESTVQVYYNGRISSWLYDYTVIYVPSGAVVHQGTTGSIGLNRENCPLGFYEETIQINPRNYKFSCYRTYQEMDPAPKLCPTPHPVFLETGLKIQVENDFIDKNGLLSFQRIWRSDQLKFIYLMDARLVDGAANQAGGSCYLAFYSKPTPTGSVILPYCTSYTGNGSTGVQRSTQDGNTVAYQASGSQFVSPKYINDTILKTTDQAGNAIWRVYTDDAIETYNGSGTLIQKNWYTGRSVKYIYSTSSTGTDIAPRAGFLISMVDDANRSINLAYNNFGSIKALTDPAGKSVQYFYDESIGNCPTEINQGQCQRLTSVVYQDNQTRRYHYNEANHIHGPVYSSSLYLTGITDENGLRLSDYIYDAQGRTLESGWGVDNYKFSYDTNQTSIVNPVGFTRTVNYENILGKKWPTSYSQPAGSGCMASTRNLGYDVNGNKASEDNFNGNRTCYVNDLTRNLESTRVEGLANTVTCSTVTPANATLPANSRKTSTQWHPNWRLPVQVAEPGKLTTSVYNGQPDPTAGNAIASCAPATALLPDGKPIAVLCKQVEQATTDGDGSKAFAALLQAGVAARITRWTYNAFGQVLTEDGPRTDVSDVTTYTYYADTTADHTQGDLQSMTNAAGKVTQYTKYNKHGQLLQSTDANGVLTVMTYDLRQRPLSVSVGGQSTTMTYDAAGQLKQVKLPDGSLVAYTYDAAHRLIAVADRKGNRIDYQLDNAGNRIGETSKDPAGTLQRQLARSIDALGRVQQTTGR